MRRSKNEYIVLEEYSILRITSEKHGVIDVMIDTEDIEKLQQLQWCVQRQRYKGNFYIYNRINKLQIHRYLIDTPEGMVVDHINRDTLDNRKSNLRNCSTADNNLNRDFPDSNTGIKYIHKIKKKNSNRIVYMVNLHKKGYKNNSFYSLENAIKYLNECKEGLHRKEKK